MAKKKTKTHSHSEVLNSPAKGRLNQKANVIDIPLDEDFMVPEGPNESLLPKMVEMLPVLKQSTDLKIQDPLTIYLKEISRHKLLTIEEEQELTLEL